MNLGRLHLTAIFITINIKTGYKCYPQSPTLTCAPIAVLNLLLFCLHWIMRLIRNLYLLNIMTLGCSLTILKYFIRTFVNLCKICNKKSIAYVRDSFSFLVKGYAVYQSWLLPRSTIKNLPVFLSTPGRATVTS